MILNPFNYPQKPQNKEKSQPKQSIHKIQDSLALRVLLNTKQKEIENLANIFRLTYYINEQQSYIETFEQEGNNLDNYMMDGANNESTSQYFIEQVNILLEEVKKTIKSRDYECNSDEYQKIQKMIKTNKAYQKIFKERAQLNFVNFDNTSEIESLNSYVPDVLKKYVIDNQISLKICTIQKPDQLNLNFFDYFLINMSPNGLFTDSFGQDLYESNKQFKQKIKSIKYEIRSNNSLLIEQFDLNKKEEDEKDKQDIDYIFVNSNQVRKTTPLTLCIQTATEEKNCLANLKLILDKIQLNNLDNRRGYFQFGLSLNNSCSELYLKSIVEFLREVNQLQKNNFFKLPSEFWVIVSEGNENRVLNIMNSLFQKDDNYINNYKPKKQNYISYYSSNPTDKKYFTNDIKDIIKKAQDKGLQAVPFVLNDDQVQFYQIQPMINPVILSKKNPRNMMGRYIPPIASYPRPIPFKPVQEEEVYRDTFRIDLVKMQMQGQLQNAVSPIFEEGGSYSFINQGTMKTNRLDQGLSKIIKIYLTLGIKSFTYQMNLLNNQFTSTFCELKFSDDTIRVIGGKKTDNQKQPLTQFYAEGVDEEDDLMQEDLLDDVDKMEVEEFKKQSDEITKYKRPKLIIRGNDECINLIGYIMQDIEQNKYILHEIKISSNIPKDVTKLFTQLETIYKVWINVGQKSITIQGYRKTLKHLLPIIYKAILEIPLNQQNEVALFKDLKVPTHWEKQDDNVKLVNINLNTEEAKKVIEQFQRSMQGTPIIKIERIQNISLMKNYLFEKQKLIEKGNSTERLLFHGSRTCNPSIIYSSAEQGFDFRLGSEGGMYGKGTYFHDDSSYSNSFKFTLPNGRSQMFLATVLIGNCVSHPAQQFVAPPFVNQAKGIRYDSVRCMAQQGHNQYIVYHNSKSYPLYLITY